MATRRPAHPLTHAKHWFVPHTRNDHRPHLIRAHGLAIVAALIIGVQITGFALQPAASHVIRPQVGHVLDYATDINRSDLFTQTNQQRADNGLSPLRLSSELDESATLKANDMFAEDYWAHVSPTGIQPWYWFTKVGYSYSYAGENLAKDFGTTAGVMSGWMNSPGHRANILNPHYIDVGFAVENGTLVGGETTLVVAHYGAPAGLSVGATVAPPSPKPAPVVAPVSGEPSPVSTPAPTLPPTPTHSTSPTSHAPATNGNIAPGEPAPQSYSLFKPLSLTRTLNWPTLITIFLLLVLLMVYVFTHMVVWRKGLKRWRSSHYRLFAATQISLLVVIILVLATSGFGQVG